MRVRQVRVWLDFGLCSVCVRFGFGLCSVFFDDGKALNIKTLFRRVDYSENKSAVC